jgi:hypothetical protein
MLVYVWIGGILSLHVSWAIVGSAVFKTDVDWFPKKNDVIWSNIGFIRDSLRKTHDDADDRWNGDIDCIQIF